MGYKPYGYIAKPWVPRWIMKLLASEFRREHRIKGIGNGEFIEEIRLLPQKQEAA